MFRMTLSAFRAVAAFFSLACACGNPAAWSATIVVDNAASGSVFGACTLQDAVVSADTDLPAPGSTCATGNGDDTIVFAPGIDHIVLTTPASFFDPSALVVTTPLTIDGGAVENSGVPAVTIERAGASGTADFRLIHATSALTLKGIALVNGHLHDGAAAGSGAGILFAPADSTVALTLADSAVRDSAATGDAACGGGIAVQGGASSTITHSTISGNRLSGAGAFGAGICETANAQPLTMSQTTIDSNIASGANSAGGGIHAASGMILDHATVSNNQVQGTGSLGGGIHLAHTVSSPDSSLYLNNGSQVIGNAAVSDTSDGGGIYFDDRTNGNDRLYVNAPPNPFGGGQMSDTYPAVRIGGNSAGRFGGGLYRNGGKMTLSHLLIDANTAAKGGGGIYTDGNSSDPADAIVDNATISGNRVTAADGIGGGIADASFTLQTPYSLSLTSVTIAANSIAAGALGAGLYLDSTLASMDSTLIYGNSGGFDVDTVAAPALNGLVQGDYNLVGTMSARAGGAVDGQHNLSCDPHLGPLADNGGNTMTHALAPGSCAIGAGHPGINNPLLPTSWDQRGQPYNRRFNTPDIGAYEAQAVFPTNGACATEDNPNNQLDYPYSLPGQMCSAGPVANITISPNEYGSDPAITWQCLGQAGGATASCFVHKSNLQFTIHNGDHGSLAQIHASMVDCASQPVFCSSIAAGQNKTYEMWIGIVFTMTITPDAGYAVSRISGCGGGTLSGNTYTTAPMESDDAYHTIGVCDLYVEYSNVAVNGACGPDNGRTLFSAPAQTCSSGVSSVPSGSGPWTWTCAGVNGGTTANCSTATPQYWPVSVMDAQNPPQGPAHGQAQGGDNQNFLGGIAAVVTLLPDAGYATTSASGCGGHLDGNVYTTEALAGPCEIYVTFSEAYPPPVDGVCGTDNGRTLPTPPTALCTAGPSSLLLGNGPWFWSCGGQYGGATAACSAQTGAAATMWTVTPHVAAGSGSFNPAAPQTVDDGGSVAFTLMPGSGYAIGGVSGCGGSLSGNVYTTGAVTADCEVDATFVQAAMPVDGACGSDDGKTLSAAPTNLCSVGTPSAVAGNGPWTWTCTGLDGGSTASCSAQLQIAGATATTTALSASPNPAVVNQTVTMQVVVTAAQNGSHAEERIDAIPAAVAPGGSAVVSDGTSNCIATISNGSGSCAMAFATAGIHNLTATYSGDANYLGSSASFQLVVNAAAGSPATVAAPAVGRWGLALLTILLMCASSAGGTARRRQR